LKGLLCSGHPHDEFIDLLLPVSEGSSVLVRMPFLLEALDGRSELEGPQEVVGLLEVRAHGRDLVDQVFNADDALLAQLFLDNAVLHERDAAVVYLAVAAFVDDLADGRLRRVAVSHVGLNSPDHVDSRFVKLHENAVVQLA
jgi:hypothetical protein